MELQNFLKEKVQSANIQVNKKKRKTEKSKRTGPSKKVANEKNINQSIITNESTLSEKEIKSVTKKELSEKEKELRTLILDDYSKLSKENLFNAIKLLVKKEDISKIQDAVNNIKSNFYKIYRSEVDIALKAYKEANNTIEEFVYNDPLEKELKVILKDYRTKKLEYNRRLEVEKNENLQKKYQIIESIKNLVTSKESMNKTFHEFKELQKQWFEIGIVPQSQARILWETYNHHVENFYDYLKINRQLRDLDYQKNLEAKIKICNEAEALIEHSKVIEAFRNLQNLHQQWREIGPVYPKDREEIWQRFKRATHQINKQHQNYFSSLKQEQNQNLEKKTILCEKVESLLENKFTRFKDWNDAIEKVKQWQQEWKKIGYAPKKYNSQIYKRFRAVCDKFFENKRDFNQKVKKELKENLQLKKTLYEKALSLKDNKDWEKTKAIFIDIQQQWKDIGPIPHKYSTKLWDDFREACNYFFNRKENKRLSLNAEQAKNLQLKRALIKEMQGYKYSDDIKENLKNFKKFQERFLQIGLVPYKEKDKIKTMFRNGINQLFDKLSIDETIKEIYRFKNKITMLKKQDLNNRIHKERQRLVNKISQLESNINIWDNNIGFFSNTSGDENKFIQEYQQRIDKGKKSLRLYKKKLKIIDTA